MKSKSTARATPKPRRDPLRPAAGTPPMVSGGRVPKPVPAVGERGKRGG